MDVNVWVKLKGVIFFLKLYADGLTMVLTRQYFAKSVNHARIDKICTYKVKYKIK